MGISKKKWGGGGGWFRQDSKKSRNLDISPPPKKVPRRHFFAGVLVKADYLSDFKDISYLKYHSCFLSNLLSNKIIGKKYVNTVFVCCAIAFLYIVHIHLHGESK